jgi:hypothetical protein
MIAILREPMPFLFGQVVAPLHPLAGRQVVHEMIKRYALWSAETMARVCAWGRAGWDEADAALQALIRESINRGDQLPVALTAYMQETMLQPRLYPLVSGPKKSTNWLQDFVIFWMVAQVVARRGLKPTRRQTNRSSACAVVAEELVEAGLRQVGERAVEKVWLRLAPRHI